MVFSNICCFKRIIARLLTFAHLTSLKSFILRNEVYVDNTSNDFVIYHKIINFSKSGVPFRNMLLIRPIYNTHGTITLLMGITYINVVPLHINPIGRNWFDLIEELEMHPFAIVLTSPVSPFVIKFVNEHWEHMTGYTSADVVGKTFRIIQGNGINKDAIQFKNKILLTLPSFETLF